MVTAEQHQHQHQHQQPDCDHHSSENEFNDNINDENDESLEAARADVELLQAAYPDEIEFVTIDTEKDEVVVRFPLTVRLHFSKTTSCELQWREGYPDESTVEIVSWRIKDAREQPCLERALKALRSAARVGSNSDYAGVGMACCAAALEAWHATHTADSSSASASTSGANLLAVSVSVSEGDLDVDDNNNNSIHCNTNINHDNDNCFTWISGDPLVDRKSVFQAHLCRLENETHVAPALQQLLTSSSKMQRATHHMYAYRITEQQQACRSYSASASADKRSDPPGNNRRNKNTPADSAANEDAVVLVVKHDNSDDGEDGAGSRLAHLLQMRHDDNVLVVVSRWYGGIPLGPKRFAHISNVARTLLVQAQQQQQPQQQHSHNCRNSRTDTPKQKGNGKK